MRGLPASNYNGIDSVFPIRFSPWKKKRKMELLANFDEKREYRNLPKQVFIYACIFFDWYYKSLLQKTSKNYSTFVQMYPHSQEILFSFLDPKHICKTDLYKWLFVHMGPEVGQKLNARDLRALGACTVHFFYCCVCSKQ